MSETPERLKLNRAVMRVSTPETCPDYDQRDYPEYILKSIHDISQTERHADGEYISHLQARVQELEAALRVADAHFMGTFSEGGTDHQTIRAALTPPEQQ